MFLACLNTLIPVVVDKMTLLKRKLIEGFISKSTGKNGTKAIDSDGLSGHRPAMPRKVRGHM